MFAGGDAVTGAATVILAMEAGKAGARGIDDYLKSLEAETMSLAAATKEPEC